MAIILDDDLENPIEYCISVILKEARKEQRLVKQLLYVMLSAYTNNPLNLAINSPTGEGKNWVLEKVAEKCPAQDVEFLSGMTDKALFHKRGILVVRNEQGEYVELDTVIQGIDNQIEDKNNEISRTKDKDLINGLKAFIEDLNEQKKEATNNAKKLIDLSHKILIFLDTPRMSLLSTLMSLLSHDRYEVEYEYVDTNNGIKTHTNILRGWPAVIFAQAIDYSKYERWPEIQRRFIVTNPEMNSKEKYQEAVDLTLDKFGLPDLVYQKLIISDREKDKVREIISSIKEEMLSASGSIAPGKNSTFVSFNEVLKNALPKQQTSDMSTAKRFSGFLSLLPIINIYKRPVIKISTSKNNIPVIQTVPIALFEDLNESIYLMEYANGVRPYVLDWYYDIFLPTFESKKDVARKVKLFGSTEQTVYESRIAATTQELIDKTKETKNKSYTSNQLLQTFIYPLMNQGYIDSVQSELDHRAHIYFPVITGKYTKLLQRDKYNNLLQITKINVTDPTIFPDNKYLISKIEWVLRCYSEEGVRATLYDHNGKEISKEELVKHYFNKPEDYFELTYDQSKNKESKTDDKKKEHIAGNNHAYYATLNNISNVNQNSDISEQNYQKDERITSNNNKGSNKILYDAKYNNIINSSRGSLADKGESTVFQISNANHNEFLTENNSDKARPCITPLDTSDPSDLRLALKHSESAVVLTNEDLASEDDS